ncbi:MAG: beta-glucuronidase [Clostridia bacterium]|nr:beta-glucuronidase [Clostridia bacterium]
MKRLFNEHIIRKTFELSGTWCFTTDPQDVGKEKGYQNGSFEGQTVTVPSCWNTELGLLNYDGVCWYKRDFYTEGGTLRFLFESVMTYGEVWLDGNYLGSHYGAFSQFDFIVPNVECGEHTLVVRVDSRATKESIPQKKVDWFNYGGIARDVYVEVFKGICVLYNLVKYNLTEDLSGAYVGCDLELYNGNSTKCSTLLCVCVGEHKVFEKEVTIDGNSTLCVSTDKVFIEKVSLWELDSPVLYTVVAKTDTDDLIDKIGFRLIEAKDTKIWLNKKSIELRGVNRHDEHPDWGFAFPPKLMKKDIDLIVNLGCNTIRGAHYPNSKIFVDMLDERGILFWSEIPIWGGGFPDDVLENPVVVERGLEMHREMAKYYYNHPSIIIWGIHNEIYTLYPCTRGISKLYSEYLRANGGNRLITHAAAFPLEDDSLEFDDIICINMYKGWYGGGLDQWDKFVCEFDQHRKKLGQDKKPVVISEFGAGALAGFHSHFDTVRWSEEYQADLLKYCLELFHKTDYIQGYYIWQFCNIRTWPEMDLNRVRCFNNKGILDEYRNPKASYFTVKELNERFIQEEN